MKVVFCFHTNDHEFNIGIAFLDAALRRHKIETDLVIFREIPGKQVDIPEEVVSRILTKSPTIIAFSIMTFNWTRVQKVVALLRPKFDGLILAGGYHTILCPEEVLGFPGIDAVCLGEGEQPLLETLEFYNQHPLHEVPLIQGMRFKNASGDEGKDTTPWLLKRLEDLPYMDYEIFVREGDQPLNTKHIGILSPAGIFSLSVITGRGCPFHCTYCNNSALMKIYGGAKLYVRRYSTNAALSNVQMIATRYQPQFLEFLDETFTMNRAWTSKFCSQYSKAVGLPFSVMTRIDRLDDEIVGLMADSGLKLVSFGLECGDEDYRSKYLNRHMSNKLIKNGARILKKHGIMVITFNMFGMPFETKDTLQRTIDLNEDIQPEVAIPFIYQPLPNTRLAQMAYDHKMVPPRSEERWDFCSPALDTPELPASYVAEQMEVFRSRFSSQSKVGHVYARLRAIAGTRPASALTEA